MGKRYQHVVPHDEGWAVRSAGREIARNQGSELLIYGRDGRLHERDSHGNDPFPPKE